MVFMLLYIAVFRIIMCCLVTKREYFQEPVLLVGAGRTAELLLDSIQRDGCYFYSVAGIVDDHPISSTLPRKYPLLGALRT